MRCEICDYAGPTPFHLVLKTASVNLKQMLRSSRLCSPAKHCFDMLFDELVEFDSADLYA